MSQSRGARIERNTSETQIELTLELDGSGQARVDTGIGFFDHMLTLFARHGLFDLQLRAVGDLHVDFHHTVEDVGIVLGQAFRQALGDKSGIRRYGYQVLPMEESLVTVAVDLSGRTMVVYRAEMPTPKIGEFDSELVQDFWLSLADQLGCNLHVLLHHGRNSHHIAEAIFKGAARALRQAVERDPRQIGIPSTKGTLV